MTRRRPLAAIGGAMAVLLTAGAVLCLAFPRPGISRANCARIKMGMRQGEVEAVLGGPPGDYQRGQLLYEFPYDRSVVHGEIWRDDAGQIVVFFRKDGTVEKALFVEWPLPSPSILDRLRSLLP